MKVLKKLFVSEEPDKQIYEILERGKSLLEKNFFDWAAVEFNKAMGINPELATETVTKLFQEMQGGGNPDAIISLGINILQTDPGNIELANLIGNAYRKKHDWKRAKNMYQHCLKHDADNKFAIYNLAATMARVEIQDGMAISAIKEFEKMSDFVLPEVKDGIDELIEMQQHFSDEKDETDQIQNSEDIQERENDNLDTTKNTNQSEDTKSKNEHKNYVDAETKDQKEENQAESSSIDPHKTFNYITSSLETESKEEEKALFTLGIYCLKHNEANIAQRAFKRLLMREKGNFDLRCFLLLAISQNNEIDKAIKTFQGILANNPNHRYSNVNMGILFKRKGLIQKSRVRFFTTFKLLERSQGDYDVNSCIEAADKLFHENHEKKALEIYEPLIPEISSEELLSRIAGIYIDRKNWDGAYDVYRRVLRKNRRNNEAREGLKSIYTAFLSNTENYLKKNDPGNAAIEIEKALKIVQSKKLIHKAVSIHRLLENENKVFEFEQILKKIEKEEIQIKISEKIRLAQDKESKAEFKAAINYYQEAIKIDPQNSTLKKLVDLCSRIKRPDLAEKFTNWFNEYQHSFQEKLKAQAREAFKKSDQTQKESK